LIISSGFSACWAIAAPATAKRVKAAAMRVLFFIGNSPLWLRNVDAIFSTAEVYRRFLIYENLIQLISSPRRRH
jgi:hypothetical protein